MEEKDIKTYECINKEELNVQNQRNLLISQLKIFGIWYIVAYVCCLYYFYWTIYQEDRSLSIIPMSFALPFILLFVVLIANLPAILILFLLFKKYNNRRSRIICASISIPFTIAIYVILGYFYLDALESALAIATVGASYVFFTIITLIATAIAPKSLIPNKTDIIYTIIFTVLFSVGLFVISCLIIHIINCF